MYAISRLELRYIPRMDELSLVEQRRRATEEHLVKAARRVAAEKGLATTMDDVAAAAGVSRRTVFRYFATRDELLTATLESGLRSFDERIPRISSGEDPGEWLESAMVAIHRLHAKNGRLYWELAMGQDLPQTLAAARDKRREARLTFVRRFSGACWKRFGGEGKAPAWLVDVFALQLSAFATQALLTDFDRSPEQSGRLAARVLRTLMAEALRERKAR